MDPGTFWLSVLVGGPVVFWGLGKLAQLDARRLVRHKLREMGAVLTSPPDSDGGPTPKYLICGEFEKESFIVDTKAQVLTIPFERELPLSLGVTVRDQTGSEYQVTGFYQTGDPSFDDRFAVGGQDDRVLAYFPKESRDLLMSLGDVRIYVSGIYVTLQVKTNKKVGRSPYRLGQAHRAVASAVALKKNLFDQISLERRLQKNIYLDPSALFRTTNLFVWVRYLPPETPMIGGEPPPKSWSPELGFLKIWTGVEHPLSGYRALFPHIYAPLAPILFIGIDRLPADMQRTLSCDALGYPELLDGACTQLGELRDPTAIPHLIAAFRQHLNHRHRDRIIEIMPRFEDSRVLPFLIRVLMEPDEGLQCEAAEALSKCGDRASIEALALARERFPECRQAASLAIAEIQGRLGLRGDESGFISVAEEDVDRGQLSLADTADRGGELSFSEQRATATVDHMAKREAKS
ncbi:HEAT repeat domain-containing protein [Sulfidibacter corallicola]|uniref:HEAT repeat domain-containing protein n=1 Tax=Sulfidibacter corallicola TaxID=2818388 RepID=A0A8A4TRW0_SULCO|nr:HEAT repeat domain-containing protein [Sulfidibacter corallicola]QTD52696.1 HEAT repeat domain-containing protein [Sulfidibacter corallicola]